MKIVIDIDNESYDHIKAYKNDDVLPMGWYAIIHGTPLTKVDCISRQAVFELIDFYDGQNQQHFTVDNLRDDVENVPSVIPKGVTVTDFADKCRECGREKVLDKIRAEIAIPTNSSTIKDYDEGWEDAIKRDLQIIDKYKAESGGEK